MESFVISGKAKTVFRLIELKAKIEMLEKNTQERLRDARRLKSMSIVNSLPLNVEGLNGHTN